MKISEYTILDKIGAGGMGCVYKGKDPNGNTIAIKMMSNRVTCYPEYRNLFNMEVKTLAELNNPSVVKIVGSPFSDKDGNMYLPMQFIEGETIEQHVKANGPYDENSARIIMGKILDAMSYIYDMGKIHRDIKPSNIMLRPDGSICIIDFGIAKDAHISTGHTVGTIIGTENYMSPEQAKGDNIDRRTDIYSLGCLLFYMLSGRDAIKQGSNNHETTCNILGNQIPSIRSIVPGTSEEIEKIIFKAADKNMTLRYQSPHEFKAALNGTTQQTTGYIMVKIGRSHDNDIVIDSQYVSGHHAEIICRPTNSPTGSYVFEFTDKSSNGTGIDGRFLKHGNQSIAYEGTSNLPQILLAGRSECMLDWNKVIAIMKSRGGLTPPLSPPPPPPPLPQTEKLGIGLSILSFICPLVGWVLWGIWKNDKPDKAQRAAQIAWIGFIINSIINIIVGLSS